MLITCYYFDQVRQEYYKTSFGEMLQIEKEDYSDVPMFLKIYMRIQFLPVLAKLTVS